jgi:hypothetical protein
MEKAYDALDQMQNKLNDIIVLQENKNGAETLRSPAIKDTYSLSEIEISKAAQQGPVEIYPVTSVDMKHQYNNYNQIEKSQSMKNQNNTEREVIRLDEEASDTDPSEFTDKDYKLMTVDQSLQNDKRGFLQYYFKHLVESHLILSAFYYKTILTPQYVRIVHLFLSISLYFALNAIFYTDDFIQSRSQRKSSSVNLL